MKRLLVLLLVAGSARAEDIAIVGAKVHVRPGTVIENATVVIRGGRIAAVAAGAPIPAGARRIEGAGKVVTAGLVEAQTRVGLIEVGAEPLSGDGSFPVRPNNDDDVIHAAYRVTDGYNPASVSIPVARAGGVTSVVAAPTGGLVSGTSAWYSLADGATPVRAPVAMHAALGIDGAGAARGSRGMAFERLRELLDDAAAYAKNKGAYERNQSRRMAAARLDLEALQPVLRGTLPLVVTAARESDIRAALRLAAELRLRLVITGGAEAWRVAKELARAKVPVILDPQDNLPGNFDAVHVRDDGAAVLAAAGVEVAVSTLGDASSARTIRQLAGMAVANGLPWDKALAAVTTVPAHIYGIADRGEVRAGAAADVVVWSGDPLELGTRAEVVVIGGTVQSLSNHQTRLLERYRTLPQR